MLRHYHTVEILTFELGFLMPPTMPVHGPSLQRTDVLVMCLTATRALLKICLSPDAKPHVCFSSVTVAQIYLATSTLSKLSLFDAEDWGVSFVQSPMDLSNFIDHLVMMTEKFSAQYDLMECNKPWLQISLKMNMVNIRLRTLLEGENPLSASLHITQLPESLLPPFFHLDQFDLLDDRFWQTLLDDTAIHNTIS